MKQAPHDFRLRALAIVFAAMPFAFGLIRAIRTGYDLRYVWVALASLCGPIAIATVTRSGRPNGLIVLTAGAFAGATLLAMVAGWLVGANPGLGLLVVASAFAFCFAFSYAFHVLAGRLVRNGERR